MEATGRSKTSRSARAELAAVALAILSGSALADDTLRCGNRLIDTGMTAAEVEAKCGPPDSKDVERAPIRGRAANGASVEIGVTTIESWTYERGARLPARLTFEDGRLEHIELLTRP